MRHERTNIAGLCKGSTADSDSVCEGSNPSPAAKESDLKIVLGRFLYFVIQLTERWVENYFRFKLRGPGVRVPRETKTLCPDGQKILAVFPGGSIRCADRYSFMDAQSFFSRGSGSSAAPGLRV